MSSGGFHLLASDYKLRGGNEKLKFGKIFLIPFSIS